MTFTDSFVAFLDDHWMWFTILSILFSSLVVAIIQRSQVYPEVNPALQYQIIQYEDKAPDDLTQEDADEEDKDAKLYNCALFCLGVLILTTTVAMLAWKFYSEYEHGSDKLEFNRFTLFAFGNLGLSGIMAFLEAYYIFPKNSCCTTMLLCMVWLSFYNDYDGIDGLGGSPSSIPTDFIVLRMYHVYAFAVLVNALSSTSVDSDDKMTWFALGVTIVVTLLPPLNGWYMSLDIPTSSITTQFNVDYAILVLTVNVTLLAIFLEPLRKALQDEGTKSTMEKMDVSSSKYSDLEEPLLSADNPDYNEGQDIGLDGIMVV